MLLGAVLGFASIAPVFAIWHRSQLPLERFYFTQYVGSTLAQTPIGTMISFFNSPRNTRTYFVLMQSGEPVTSAAGLNPAYHVSVRLVSTTPRIFSVWLQNQIYQGRDFQDVLQASLESGRVSASVCFFVVSRLTFSGVNRSAKASSYAGPIS